MAAYNDPTVLHEGECSACGKHVRDADTLDDNGDCWECAGQRGEKENEDA